VLFGRFGGRLQAGVADLREVPSSTSYSASPSRVIRWRVALSGLRPGSGSCPARRCVARRPRIAAAAASAWRHRVRPGVPALDRCGRCSRGARLAPCEGLLSGPVPVASQSECVRELRELTQGPPGTAPQRMRPGATRCFGRDLMTLLSASSWSPRARDTLDDGVGPSHGPNDGKRSITVVDADAPPSISPPGVRPLERARRTGGQAP